MKRQVKRLIATLASGFVVLGSEPSVADDLPGRPGAEAKFSPSLGTDRLLESRFLSAANLSRDGRRVADYGRNKLYVWDSASGRPIFEVEDGPPNRYHGFIDIDESGRRIVTWMIEYGHALETFRSQFVPSGNPAVQLWDVGTGRLTRSFTIDERLGVRSVAINRNGTQVSCVGSRLGAKLWDADTGRELTSIDNVIPPSEIQDVRGLGVSFSGDATRFAALTNPLQRLRDQGTIHLGDLGGRRTRTIGPLPDGVSVYGAVAVSDDGRRVVALLGNTMGHTLFVEPTVDEESRRKALIEWPPCPPGRELAIFDFDTGNLLARLPGPGHAGISYLAFSPDGETIALGREDGSLYLIDQTGVARIAELHVSDGPVRAVAFLDGRVRVVAERAHVANASPTGGDRSGPVKIADYRVRLTP